MSPDRDSPFESGRARPIATVLDALRARLDSEDFDGALLWLECVAVDLGYGDVRPLPGSVAWIDELRRAGKKLALLASGERAGTALELAGVGERFDCLTVGPREAATFETALGELGLDPGRALAVDASAAGIGAARDLGIDLIVAVARGGDSPEELRRAGADMVVADLQELLGSTEGRDR